MLKPRLTALDEKEILRYLGYGGQPMEPPLTAQLRRCIRTVTDTARPRAVYRRFALDGTTLREAGLTLAGADIAAHLAGCHAAVLMAATAGLETDALLRQAQVRGMGDAVIMDACASAVIENVCDNLEADLRREYESRGEYLTGRFSPGYGDMPLCQQGDVLAALNAGRAIGLTLTETDIMIPGKSVTAVMGIACAPGLGRERGCASCGQFETCAYRRRGTVCGKP